MTARRPDIRPGTGAAPLEGIEPARVCVDCHERPTTGRRIVCEHCRALYLERLGHLLEDGRALGEK